MFLTIQHNDVFSWSTYVANTSDVERRTHIYNDDEHDEQINGKQCENLAAYYMVAHWIARANTSTGS